MFLDWSTQVKTLNSKLFSVQHELEAWRKLVTPDDSKPEQLPAFAGNLSRHHSQVLRLAKLFEGILSSLNSRLSQLSEGHTYQAKLELNQAILQACQFWAYFQSKFLSRLAESAGPFLLAADEFAWACLKPLNNQRAQVPGFVPKSPPLIYLGPKFSPFVIPADWSLKSQVIGVTDQLFDQFMSSAPFAVLGLPFYQTKYLPEVMILSHEMGHVVDFDLGLTKSLDAAIAALPDKSVPPERKAVWAKCRIESFADVFGAAQGGPAFVEAFAHLLAITVDDVAKQSFLDCGTRSYPTVYLRISLCIEALKIKGELPTRAEQTLEQWRGRYGLKHTMQKFEDDLAHIVRAYLDTGFAELSGKSIRDCIEVNPDDYDTASDSAKRMIDHFEKPATITDARVLLAAAALAYFDNPSQYATANVEYMVLTRMAEIVDNAARSADAVEPCLSDDEETGHQLAKLLGQP